MLSVTGTPNVHYKKDRRMKVVFLGYGMAGLIFDAIVSNIAPEIEVKFITLDKLPASDFGLRYIHDFKEEYDSSDDFSSIYSFIDKAMGRFYTQTSVALEFAVRTGYGYLPGRVNDLDQDLDEFSTQIN